MKILSYPQMYNANVKSKCLNFKEDYSSEKTNEVPYGQLNHTTHFFRYQEIDNAVVDYILNNFSSKPRINIVSGGCSDGEEAYTYSMLLNNIKDKVNITGFDLSEDIIKKATEGVFSLSRSIEKHLYCADNYEEPYKKQQRELFSRFFEPCGVDEENQPKYRLKEGKLSNCRFIQGDVRKIKDPKSSLHNELKNVDVFLFRNVLYHLIDKNANEEETKKTIREIMEQIKSTLSSGGLLVTTSELYLDEILPEMGFTPLMIKDGKLKKADELYYNNNYTHIWRKN